jgi:hypothetical protein
MSRRLRRSASGFGGRPILDFGFVFMTALYFPDALMSRENAAGFAFSQVC